MPTNQYLFRQWFVLVTAIAVGITFDCGIFRARIRLLGHRYVEELI